MYNILIWGTGVHACELLQNGLGSNVTVLGFVETSKSAEHFRGIAIYEPKSLPGSYDYIIVATEYSDQILEVCKNVNLDISKVIFLYPGKETSFCEASLLKDILGDRNYQRYMWEYNVGDDIINLNILYNKLLKTFDGMKRYSELLHAASECNKRAFSELRACCLGKKIVICGAGPSLNDFVPIEDAVYIALNRAVLYPKVQFDYMFADDWIGLEQYQDEIVNVKCKKYFGATQTGEQYMIPETFYTQNNAIKYYKDDFLRPGGFNSEFVCDIDLRPIGNMPNIALQVMQVALFMQPEVIYLVGCDASTAGHFNISAEHESNTIQKDLKQCISAGATLGKWKELKHFIDVHYPDVEIISINPVGLKGLFNDIYQNTVK